MKDLTTVVATFAFIINNQNKVLLIRRAKHDSFPGRWELPGGGLDYGEKPELSIAREVMEEVGIQVKVIKPISVITHKNQDKSKEIVRITYECQMVDAKDQVNLSNDHDAFEWVPLEKVGNHEKNSPLNQIMKTLKDIYLPQSYNLKKSI